MNPDVDVEIYKFHFEKKESYPMEMAIGKSNL
jgi:hypothetical protein